MPLAVLRRADDHFKYMATFHRNYWNCITFDQVSLGQEKGTAVATRGKRVQA